MKRRDLLAAGTVGALTSLMGNTGAGAAERNTTMKPLDYGLSFICHSAAFNSVRFWVESRTRLIDDTNGTQQDFYQCASCKSENTFGEKDLLYEDNYDFMPIFGGDHVTVFRRPVRLSDIYRTVKPVDEMWGPPGLRLAEGGRVQELSTWEEIRDATAAATPLVTQTEIANPETGLRAIIECPTKTMNISIDKKMYQVDTGPIAFPDLAERHDPAVGGVSLAFVVFNAPHFADFVIEQPTPVVEDGVEKCRVYHYSNPFSLPAKNRVFAVERA